MADRIRRSKIGLMRDYFKSGDLDEVEVVLKLVTADVAARQAKAAQLGAQIAGGRPKRNRKPASANPGPLLPVGGASAA